MNQKKPGRDNDNTSDQSMEYEAYTVVAEDRGPAKWIKFHRGELIPDNYGWPPAHLMFMRHASDIKDIWFDPGEQLDELWLLFRNFDHAVQLKGGNFDKKGKYGISLIDGFWQQRVNGVFRVSSHHENVSETDPWIGAITLER